MNKVRKSFVVVVGTGGVGESFIVYFRTTRTIHFMYKPINQIQFYRKSRRSYAPSFRRRTHPPHRFRPSLPLQFESTRRRHTIRRRYTQSPRHEKTLQSHLPKRLHRHP